jgi:hypothetical protein
MTILEETGELNKNLHKFLPNSWVGFSINKCRSMESRNTAARLMILTEPEVSNFAKKIFVKIYGFS